MSKNDRFLLFVVFGAALFGSGMKGLVGFIAQTPPSLEGSVLATIVGIAITVFGGYKLSD